MRLEALAQLKPAYERLSLPLPPDMPSAARSYVNTCDSKIHETTAGCVLLEHQSRPAAHVGTIVIQAFVVPAVRQQCPCRSLLLLRYGSVSCLTQQRVSLCPLCLELLSCSITSPTRLNAHSTPPALQLACLPTIRPHSHRAL